VGDFFNPNADVPDGWFYWWPDFSAGKTDWETNAPVLAGQTSAEAHSGESSLQMTKESTEWELVVNSDPTDFVNDGTPLLFSAWVMTEMVEGTSDLAHTDGSYGMGFTVTWHDGSMGDDGWGEVGGTDYQFTVAGDTTDWTQYQVALAPPSEASQYSLRARYWPMFRGTTYWDDFEVRRTAPLAIDENPEYAVKPDKYDLLYAYPNPFNPTVNLSFDIAQQSHVTMLVFDLLGRKIATLLDKPMQEGHHLVQWGAMTDNGSPVPSGVYLVQVRYDNQIQSLKSITYLK
ncbi:MAG: T9SS type A sorting domain-containing protein, partial [Candidatus Marinimicrobia bacterium]|nr:T9SS type A sorting domain-containing protein [Candidatus Neomarinimicrobiota bacterium]